MFVRALIWVTLATDAIINRILISIGESADAKKDTIKLTVSATREI